MREITALPFLLRMDTRNPRMMKKEKMMILHRNIKLSISPSISFFILFVSIPCYLFEFDCYRRWKKNCLYNSLLKDFAKPFSVLLLQSSAPHLQFHFLQVLLSSPIFDFFTCSKILKMAFFDICKQYAATLYFPASVLLMLTNTIPNG